MPRRSLDWWWSPTPTLIHYTTNFAILSSTIDDPRSFPSLTTTTTDDSSPTDPPQESGDSFPTVAQPTSTFGPIIQPVVTSLSDHSTPLSIASTTNSPLFTTPLANALAVNSEPVCIGDGLDASLEGVLVSIAVSSALGLTFWVRCDLLLPKLTNGFRLTARVCDG